MTFWLIRDLILSAVSEIVIPEDKLSANKFWLVLASKSAREMNCSVVKLEDCKDAEIWRLVFTVVPALEAAVKKFAKEVIPKYIRKDAQKYLDSLKSGNEQIILCSASLSIYLKAWAASQGIVYVFGTELEQNDKNYTGKIEGENVWGQGKVNRINSELLKYAFIITEAYGDSRGDTEMLALAEKPCFKPFR